MPKKTINSAIIISTYLRANIPSTLIPLFFFGWGEVEIFAFLFMLSAKIGSYSFRKNNWKNANTFSTSNEN